MTTLMAKESRKASTGGVHHPLDAIPFVPEGVLVNVNDLGLVRLSLEVPPRGRVRAFLATRLGWRRKMHFELDAIGSDYWKAIDGQKNLRAIAGQLAREHQLSERESTDAVVKYTAHLMRRSLLCLELPHKDSTR